MGSILERIKSETKIAHHGLEKKVVSHLKEITSDEDYARFLKYFYSFFQSLEEGFTPFITPSVLEDVDSRRDASYLKEDIAALGVEAQSFEIVHVPVIGCLPQALGAMYVREGSTMGGHIIVEMLAQCGINKGVSFFAGYGVYTKQRWQLFQKVMFDTLNSSEDQDMAIASANDTFKYFGKLFDQYQDSEFNDIR